MTWETRAQLFLHDIARFLALVYQRRLSITRARRWTQKSLTVLAGQTGFHSVVQAPQSEQDAPVLVWLRELVGGAGLIGAAGRSLRLSSTAYEWVNRPPAFQLQTLRRIWFWNLEMTWQWATGRHDSRLLNSWWRHVVLEILRAIAKLPCDAWTHAADIEAGLQARGVLDWQHIAQNLPAVANAMARRVPAMLRLLFEDILPCLALIEVHGEGGTTDEAPSPCMERGLGVRLHPTPESVDWLASALARHRYFASPPANTAIDQDIPDAELQLPAREDVPLAVTAGLEVTVALDALPCFTFDVASFAELVDVGPPARYRVTRASMQEAVTWGYPAADVIFILDRFSGGRLPGPARARLQGWRDETVQADCEPGYRVQMASAALVNGLRHRRPFRSRTLPFAAGRNVWVSHHQAKDLFRYLRQQGYTVNVPDTPEPEPGSPSPHVERGPGGEVRRPLPLRKLLVLMRTYEHVRQLVPTLTDLELGEVDAIVAEALAPGELAGVERLVLSQAGCLVEHVACGEPEAVERLARWVEQHSSLEDYVARIQTAIDAEAPLHLTYIDAGARITQRVVRPLELVERWEQRYLVAFCESRQDERHFRLDRVVALEEAT
ncbi:MAG: WYL domain-containing protein [Anaerolineae bacterium]|nr:WYL domain-containing protein [Anaerolineae bacterium]